MRTRINLPQYKSNFSTLTQLEGTNYKFYFRWNDRIARWFFKIEDSVGDEIMGWTKIVADYPLTSLVTADRIFPGNLFALDTTGEGRDPGLRDLGSRVVLYYIWEGDLS